MKFIRINLFALLLVGVASNNLVAAPQSSKGKTKKDSIAQGKVFVQAACTACHSTMVINNANKSQSGWIKTLEKMVKQGMPKVPATFEASIIEYLTQEHGKIQSGARENRGPWGDRRNANPLW
ncbi:hypothetical protein OAH36_02325 [Verrucomicrobia bacterium]|jgi:hypothetical protein|nr:hypothetical protein [bacterium]MDB4798413.1 hypothetical protein [Verrucomicrobiota bacterium]